MKVERVNHTDEEARNLEHLDQLSPISAGIRTPVAQGLASYDQTLNWLNRIVQPSTTSKA